MLEEHSAEVIAYFGNEILQSDNTINRKVLGNIIFASSSKREELQAILHPHIQKAILTQAQQLEEKKVWYFIDIPLFFEVGGKEAYPVARSLVIYTPKAKAIERIMKRNNFTFEEAKARIDAQMPIENKCRLADDIINNEGDLRTLQHNAESYIQSLPCVDCVQSS